MKNERYKMLSDMVTKGYRCDIYQSRCSPGSKPFKVFQTKGLYYGKCFTGDGRAEKLNVMLRELTDEQQHGATPLPGLDRCCYQTQVSGAWWGARTTEEMPLLLENSSPKWREGQMS